METFIKYWHFLELYLDWVELHQLKKKKKRLKSQGDFKAYYAEKTNLILIYQYAGILSAKFEE